MTVTKYKKLAVSAIIAGVMAAPVPTAKAAECAYANEHQALGVRVLQSELMVGALSCNARTEYNAYVRRFGGELAIHGANLRAYFARTNGRSHKAYLDKFVTRAANEASQRAISQSNYCDEIILSFAALKAIDTDQLVDYADDRESAHSHGYPACSTSARATTATVE